MILYQCTTTSPRLMSLVNAEDMLLFRQDGVYLLLSEQQWPTVQLFALQQDINDRQLHCPQAVQLLSDSQWLELCLKAEQVLLC